MSRAAELLKGLSKDAKVVEIGPSYAPLASKRAGWNAVTVDHGTREELVEKYREEASVDIGMIEEVDYVWTGGAIEDVIPASEHGTFDAFIASHVIEHTPDVVRFLKSAETLIKPDGQVILAVPDKRKCFDAFRQISTTSEAIQAYEEKRSRHSARTHFDFRMYMTLKQDNPAPGWSIDDRTRNYLAVADPRGRDYLAMADAPHYVDAHNWVFVPASLELMIQELSYLGYLDLEVSEARECHFTEFFMWLRKTDGKPAADEFQEKRRYLLEHVIVQLAEQSRQIAWSPLANAQAREAEEAARKAERKAAAAARR